VYLGDLEGGYTFVFWLEFCFTFNDLHFGEIFILYSDLLETRSISCNWPLFFLVFRSAINDIRINTSESKIGSIATKQTTITCIVILILSTCMRKYMVTVIHSKQSQFSACCWCRDNSWMSSTSWYLYCENVSRYNTRLHLFLVYSANLKFV
jgi:hypothetical protein